MEPHGNSAIDATPSITSSFSFFPFFASAPLSSSATRIVCLFITKQINKLSLTKTKTKTILKNEYPLIKSSENFPFPFPFPGEGISRSRLEWLTIYEKELLRFKRRRKNDSHVSLGLGGQSNLNTIHTDGYRFGPNDQVIALKRHAKLSSSKRQAYGLPFNPPIFVAMLLRLAPLRI